MDGHPSYPLRGLGPDRFVIGGSFQCNGTSNPASTTYRGTSGLPFTVTYSATGVYTITFPSGYRFPAQPLAVVASAQYATLATDWFEVGVLGETTLNGTARQIVLQAHRSGTANAPANTAGNRINFWVLMQNNTGA